MDKNKGRPIGWGTIWPMCTKQISMHQERGSLAWGILDKWMWGFDSAIE